MKRKLGQSLTLLLMLSVASSAAWGSDRGTSQNAAAEMPTAEDKAIAAERLAKRAAELANYASALAAESQGSTAEDAPSAWSPRGAETVFISDSKADQSTTTESDSHGGWRSPRTGPTATKISFLDDKATADESANANSENNSESAEADAEKLEADEPLAQRLPATDDADGKLILASALNSEKSDKISDENVKPVARMLADDEPLPAGLNDAPSAPSNYDDNYDTEPIPPAPINAGADYGNACGCGNDCGGACATGCCDSACCPPRRVLFWTAGVEATFLNPDLNSEGTSFLVEQQDINRSDWVSTATDDVDSMYVSPRAWIGVQGCKWGANLRYWHLQAGEGSYDPSVGPLADPWDWGSLLNTGFASSNHLEAYTIDLEITRRFCLNDCWMQASMGVRHASIEQNEVLWGTALTDYGTMMGVARANRYTRGTGLLFGLYGRKPIFPCSCVHWFWNARFSPMWGPTDTSAETGVLLAAADPDFTAAAGSNNGASTAVDDTLFVSEIQLGIEWNYALQCLPAYAFVRTAVEYQRWDGGVGYSSAFSFGGIEVDDGMNPPVPNASFIETNAAAAAPELDLVGVTFATGLTW